MYENPGRPLPTPMFTYNLKAYGLLFYPIMGSPEVSAPKKNNGKASRIGLQMLDQQ